jgi:hypothetical protein
MHDHDAHCTQTENHSESMAMHFSIPQQDIVFIVYFIYIFHEWKWYMYRLFWGNEGICDLATRGYVTHIPEVLKITYLFFTWRGRVNEFSHFLCCVTFNLIITINYFWNFVIWHWFGYLERPLAAGCYIRYTRKNLTSCSKSANKPSTSCVRTACPKLSTSLEQTINNL